MFSGALQLEPSFVDQYMRRFESGSRMSNTITGSCGCRQGEHTSPKAVDLREHRDVVERDAAPRPNSGVQRGEVGAVRPAEDRILLIV